MLTSDKEFIDGWNKWGVVRETLAPIGFTLMVEITNT